MAGGISITQMIDDFENGGDARIVPIPNKQDGYWFTYNENPEGGTCMQIPAGKTDFQPLGVVMDGANGSTFAGKTTGNGCTVWGAGMGVDLNHPGAVGDAAPAPPLALYDASAFTCLVFTAKSMNGNQVLVQLGTPSTISNQEPGGECPGPAAMCDNNYGASITLTASNATPVVNSTSIITATVTSNNQSVPNGTAVEFSTNLGTFTDTGSNRTVKTTTAGVATATLTSAAAGTATVLATVGNTQKSITVTFSAGGGGGTPGPDQVRGRGVLRAVLPRAAARGRRNRSDCLAWSIGRRL